ncbi:predicted protein [Coccidioides posadasii str. Silveira]|uniref:Predicted protein n=1 Tax=Coccidioides posadasii (strain RMSCC 757 / Silveira) TaxID=443226 RepID=E9D6L4_COCPS|nr:predicted protein [Coccidioides posadasii str. Silveira]
MELARRCHTLSIEPQKGRISTQLDHKGQNQSVVRHPVGRSQKTPSAVIVVSLRDFSQTSMAASRSSIALAAQGKKKKKKKRGLQVIQQLHPPLR